MKCYTRLLEESRVALHTDWQSNAEKRPVCNQKPSSSFCWPPADNYQFIADYNCKSRENAKACLSYVWPCYIWHLWHYKNKTYVSATKKSRQLSKLSSSRNRWPDLRINNRLCRCDYLFFKRKNMSLHCLSTGCTSTCDNTLQTHNFICWLRLNSRLTFIYDGWLVVSKTHSWELAFTVKSFPMNPATFLHSFFTSAIPQLHILILNSRLIAPIL